MSKRRPSIRKKGFVMGPKPEESYIQDIVTPDGRLNDRDFESLLREAEGSPFMLVTAIGDCLTGKSTLLRELTGDSGFRIGDGYKPKTTGAKMRSKIMLSDVLSRFDIKVPGRTNPALFFVDTEGMTEELEKKVLAPLMSVSSVVLAVLDQNSMESSLEAVDRLLKHFRKGSGPKVVFCVKTCGEMLSDGQYRGVTTDLFNAYQEEFNQVGEYDCFSVCPLPNLPDGEEPQDLEIQDYSNGMRLVAEEIVKAIKESLDSSWNDAKSVINAFKTINQSKGSIGKAVRKLNVAKMESSKNAGDSVKDVVTSDGEFCSDELKSLLDSAGDNPSAIVTVIGDYQIGKSTLLKSLTGDEGFESGNGIKSKTKGARMHRKIMLSDMCKRFGVELPDGINPALFFVDTEGTGAEGMTIELERKIVVPLISVSSIIIVLLLPNSTRDSLGTIKEILRCGQLFNTDFSPWVIFCIKTSGKTIGGGEYRFIKEDLYTKYRKDYMESKHSEILEGFKNAIVCPLPNLIKENPQDFEIQDYDYGMELVAYDVIGSIVKATRSSQQSPEDIISTFGKIVNNKGSLEMVIRQAGELRKSNTEEYKVKRSAEIVEHVLSEKKGIINAINTVDELDRQISRIIKEACDDYRKQFGAIDVEQSILDSGASQLTQSLNIERFNRVMRLMVDQLSSQSRRMLEEYRSYSREGNFKYIAGHMEVDMRKFSNFADECFADLDKRQKDIPMFGDRDKLRDDIYSIKDSLKNEIDNIFLSEREKMMKRCVSGAHVAFNEWVNILEKTKKGLRTLDGLYIEQCGAKKSILEKLVDQELPGIPGIDAECEPEIEKKIDDVFFEENKLRAPLYVHLFDKYFSNFVQKTVRDSREDVQERGPLFVKEDLARRFEEHFNVEKSALNKLTVGIPGVNLIIDHVLSDAKKVLSECEGFDSFRFKIKRAWKELFS